MEYIEKIAVHIVLACDKNPLMTTALVFMANIAFNVLEAIVEKLFFGDRFTHWLDVPFTCFFIGWAAYLVYICARLKA